MKHWPRSQMLSRKHCTLSKEEEVVVVEDEEDEEIIVEEEDVEIGSASRPRSGAAGVAPTPTTLKTVGRKRVTKTATRR